jgi:hypothetical protein
MPKLRIVCVDPGLADKVWPHVALVIRAAMQRGATGAFQPVAQSVLAGRALVWLATDGERIRAAAVTELHATEWRKVCVIVACGSVSSARDRTIPAVSSGRNRINPASAGMRSWLHLIGEIEQFAKDEGCAATRIVGRKGWARVLKDYRTKRIILEKDLPGTP